MEDVHDVLFLLITLAAFALLALLAGILDRRLAGDEQTDR
jgi:hypothetical protein